MANHSYRDTLSQQRLRPFLWTQFLGAFNDNLSKIVVDDDGAATAPQARRALQTLGAEIAVRRRHADESLPRQVVA